MSVKITSLEMENVKRVQLVRMGLNANGLTVIGGDNQQGKTSVIDGIVYALGGEKYRPSNLQREGGLAEARIRLTMSNGLIVERKGKNATLKVTDPSGRKSGQKLLDEFVEELALNLPKFMSMNDSDKADVLLQILGIGDQLKALDLRENEAYENRKAFRQVCEQKEKFAAELKEYADVPEVPVSAADLIKKSGEILARNTENDRLRSQQNELELKLHNCEQKEAELNKALEAVRADAEKLRIDLNKAAEKPIPANESTAELEAQINDIDNINAKIRANSDKAKAIADAEDYKRQLDKKTAELEKIRAERLHLLEGAKMPLEGLFIGKNEKDKPVLLYNSQAWDCMSDMEKYRVAVAIVRKLKPECGFVLLDKMESFDEKQLTNFDRWLEAEGLQAIATRVSRGEECSIIIEDGMAIDPNIDPAPEVTTTNNNIGEW